MSKLMVKIRLGLPIGSLNSERGPTSYYLKEAGIKVTNYDLGDPNKDKEAEITNFNDITQGIELEVSKDRPQHFPGSLQKGTIDAAILGDDIIRNFELSGEGEFEKLLDLGYGRVKVVVALSNKVNKNITTLDGFLRSHFRDNDTLNCYTVRDYGYIAKRHFIESRVFNQQNCQAHIVGISNGIQDVPENGKLIYIRLTEGNTESFVVSHGADMIIESTQTGNALREYKLRELSPNKPIMKSSVGLYVRKDLEDCVKNHLLTLGKLVQGVVIAQEYFDVTFNIPKGNIDDVTYILKENCGYLKGPTVSEVKSNNGHVAINVVLPRDDWPIISKRLMDSEATDLVVKKPEQICNPSRETIIIDNFHEKQV